MNKSIDEKKWSTVPLGTLAQFRNGINYTQENFGRGIKVINVKNFQSHFIATFKDLDEVNPDGIIRESDLLRKGDIIFVRSNGNRELIGRSLFVEEINEPISHSAFSIKLRFVSDKVFPKFYAYLFRSSLIRQVLSNQGNGTNISNLNQGILSNLRVPLPPIEEQRRIAAILSAYDDLIENSTQRIQVLEEMARRIYEEWFVRFRFPGHENAPLVESELGRIPQGWEVLSVTKAIEFNPQTKVPREGEKPFLPMGYLSNDSMLISGFEMRTGNSGSKFRNDDTLFARITPCLENGKTGFVRFLPSKEDVAFGSTEFIVMRSKMLCPEYVYLLARSNDFRDNAIKSMSGATGRQRVQETCFENYLIAQPDSTTLKAFSNQVSPMFKQINILANKNKNLRQTRDLLLPKLISGAIDVSEFPEPSNKTE